MSQLLWFLANLLPYAERVSAAIGGRGGQGGAWSGARFHKYICHLNFLAKNEVEFPVCCGSVPPMRIFGFKWYRYVEWFHVLREEFGRVTWRDGIRLLYSLVRTFFKGKIEKRGTYIRKLRCCHSCAVYDRYLHRCRPNGNSPLGCGCYMPFKIAMGGGCWINEEYPKEEAGWKAGGIHAD